MGMVTAANPTATLAGDTVGLVSVGPEPEPGGKKRILIVEDTKFNLILIKAYLKDFSGELDFAENGRIAVEKVKSFRPHLVLMDVQMPVMDGCDATRTIREWETLSNVAHIPILALTAHAKCGWGGRSLEAGFTEYLDKPIKRATLLETVARYLSEEPLPTIPTVVEALVPEYLASARLDMEMILAGLEKGDFEVALRLGHQLKGSGESYGFPEITRIAAAIELAALHSNATETQFQASAFVTYLDQVTR